ncbi:MAG: signal peptidase I, partial [Rickettsiales bacterium]
LYINEHKAPQSYVDFSKDSDDGLTSWTVEVKQENLLGIKHGIYQNPNASSDNFETTVPPHKYFMMGDNRDDSADSRYWGFLPEGNIVGKATRVWMSYDTPQHPIRWDRIGEKII